MTTYQPSPFNQFYDYSAGCTAGAPSISPPQAVCGIANLGPIADVNSTLRTRLEACCASAAGSNGLPSVIENLGNCTYYCPYNDVQSAWTNCVGDSTISQQRFCAGRAANQTAPATVTNVSNAPAGLTVGPVIGVFVFALMACVSIM